MDPAGGAYCVSNRNRADGFLPSSWVGGAVSEASGADTEPDGRRRPVHLRPAHLLAVWLGGTLGTASRYLIGLSVPHVGPFPVATFGINVSGAFALGVLLEGLALGGADQGRRRLVRLAVGTGFLGGFTTYSALAVETVSLWRDGLPWAAAWYALGTVVVGAAAAAAGILVAARFRRVRRARADR
jgi:fluoride exporter